MLINRINIPRLRQWNLSILRKHVLDVAAGGLQRHYDLAAHRGGEHLTSDPAEVQHRPNMDPTGRPDE